MALSTTPAYTRRTASRTSSADGAVAAAASPSLQQLLLLLPPLAQHGDATAGAQPSDASAQHGAEAVAGTQQAVVVDAAAAAPSQHSAVVVVGTQQGDVLGAGAVAAVAVVGTLSQHDILQAAVRLDVCWAAFGQPWLAEVLAKNSTNLQR